MKKMQKALLTVACFFVLFLASAGSSVAVAGEKPIKVLILSGTGNHEWRKTTPWLTRILEETALFVPQVTNKPDTLTYDKLKKFDLVIGNAGALPDKSIRMSVSWEADFLKYVKEGGGTLFLHSGASTYYGWDDFLPIGIGRWGTSTFYDAPVVANVDGFDQQHPITKGMKGFRIMDEIWEKTEVYPGAQAIGSLTATNAKDGHPISEPAVFVNQVGKGRSFFTLLGHDERAMVNSGWKALVLRAAQWCAGREVTIRPPAEIDLQKAGKAPAYAWQETDTTLALVNNHEVVWQFNYNDRFQRPYFHPLSVNNSMVTSLSPPDHPWHLGLWFCWKYINHVNYWEYLNEKRSAKTGYRSEGATEIVKKEIRRNPDFSADIRLWINYHPQEKANVMTEERNYHLTAPAQNGSYQITQDHQFKVVADSIVLDRTPPAIRGGRIQGGYAGISCRFNQDFTEPVIRNAADSAQCQKCGWQYYGFRSLTGKRVGLKIELDPKYNLPTCRWYVINDPLIPFFFYSPGVIFDDKVTFKKGQDFRLRYRITVEEEK